MRKNSLNSFIFLVIVIVMQSCVSTKRVIFFGDSITELGMKPGGYVTLIKQLAAADKLSNIDFIGTGISGNKVYDLYLRMNNDVIARKPTTVVIWIGVNDVWHKKLLQTGTDLDKFEKFYLAIIQTFKDHGATIYICTPAVIGEKWDGTNELDKELDKYSAVIRKLAPTTQSKLIDIRTAFVNYNKENNKENKEKGILTYDGVHLNDKGNDFVAHLIYNSIKANINNR